jgi:hypothetical protein
VLDADLAMVVVRSVLARSPYEQPCQLVLKISSDPLRPVLQVAQRSAASPSTCAARGHLHSATSLNAAAMPARVRAAPLLLLLAALLAPGGGPPPVLGLPSLSDRDLIGYSERRKRGNVAMTNVQSADSSTRPRGPKVPGCPAGAGRAAGAACQRKSTLCAAGHCHPGLPPCRFFHGTPASSSTSAY